MELVPSEGVQLWWPLRAAVIAMLAPITVLSIIAAIWTIGLTLPITLGMGWLCVWCAKGGADPPSRPGTFLLVSGGTIPLVIWVVVLLEGALR